MGWLLLIPFTSAYYAFVFSQLYWWFAVPAGAPNIGFLGLWGITLMLGVPMVSAAYVGGPGSVEDAPSASWTALVVAAKLLTVTIALGMGWIIHAIAT